MQSKKENLKNGEGIWYNFGGGGGGENIKIVVMFH